MGVERFGDGAWRARLPEGTRAATRRDLLEALRAEPAVSDAVVCEEHALVVLRPGVPEVSQEQVEQMLARGLAAAAPVDRDARGEAREHSVAVRYDGEDLASVAAAAGLTVDQVCALHAGVTYEVAAVGFLPGFAYLRGLHPRLVLPRRATPRPRVPASSVAIAGPYSGVYPFASPGGWHLLGTAEGFAAFDADTGARLALGDRVRFVVASEAG